MQTPTRAPSLWTLVRSDLPTLAERLKAARPPKLRILVDGRVIYWALALPTAEDLQRHARWPGQSAPSLEGWLLEYLERLERAYPGAREVEILGLWAGDPPRLERVARFWVQPKEGYLSSPSGCENANGYG
ncbi:MULTISPECIES: hypothetical protein [Thermus]|uniref:Uncharacterized protein n=1 Tax=Thermus scotoductus (strain ATCC 700910 / SA-01) TaxID=743525 RepID=E8PPH0_THESS|nr:MULTISPECIES: hypothetical protein [Thermus]ADW21636.1 conserved hypothetical protein [Thermus scotoductus SA-01]